MKYRFIIADVFTDQAYGGNPLAVFPDGTGLTKRQMQAIAREMNLSETTFVTPGSGPGRFKVQIFTPSTELPFAGHPTVGTAVVLAEIGATEGRRDFILEEEVGPINITVEAGRATFKLDSAPERRDAPPTREIAAALGVDATKIVGQPWLAGYGGVGYLCVELTDIPAVASTWLTADAYTSLNLWGIGVYVFTSTDRSDGHESVYVRSFVPGAGVPEDPATGAAAAALAGTRLDATANERCRLTITQGVDMGRPSQIDTEVVFENGEIVSVAVGGTAVMVSEGHLLCLPPL